MYKLESYLHKRVHRISVHILYYTNIQSSQGCFYTMVYTQGCFWHICKILFCIHRRLRKKNIRNKYDLVAFWQQVFISKYIYPTCHYHSVRDSNIFFADQESFKKELWTHGVIVLDVGCEFRDQGSIPSE